MGGCLQTALAAGESGTVPSQSALRVAAIVGKFVRLAMDEPVTITCKGLGQMDSLVKQRFSVVVTRSQPVGTDAEAPGMD